MCQKEIPRSCSHLKITLSGCFETQTLKSTCYTIWETEHNHLLIGALRWNTDIKRGLKPLKSTLKPICRPGYWTTEPNHAAPLPQPNLYHVHHSITFLRQVWYVSCVGIVRVLENPATFLNKSRRLICIRRAHIKMKHFTPLPLRTEIISASLSLLLSVMCKHQVWVLLPLWSTLGGLTMAAYRVGDVYRGCGVCRKFLVLQQHYSPFTFRQHFHSRVSTGLVTDCGLVVCKTSKQHMHGNAKDCFCPEVSWSPLGARAGVVDIIHAHVIMLGRHWRQEGRKPVPISLRIL